MQVLSNEVFDKVFTIVKYAMADLEIVDGRGVSVPKWADLFYARSDHELIDTHLPCLSMRQIGAPQIGNDLMRDTQNGVNSTFQVDAYSNKSYDEAYSIMNDAGDVFIRLGYALTYGVEEMPTNSESLWRFTARFNRVIGANETLAL